MYPGRNRLLYRPSGWTSGLAVTARLYDVANLELLNDNVIFDEMENEPIYYADVTLPTRGKYLLVVLHGGSRAASAVLQAGTEAGIVYRI